MTLNLSPTGEQFVVSAIDSLTSWFDPPSYTNINGKFSWTGLANTPYTVVYSFDLADEQFSGNAPDGIPFSSSVLANRTFLGDPNQHSSIHDPSQSEVQGTKGSE